MRWLQVIGGVCSLAPLLWATQPVRADREPSRHRRPPVAVGAPVGVSALIDAVTALAASDIGIAVAASTGCGAERLPGSRAAILDLVAGDHRRLIGECARGRTRLSRAVRGFDLVGLIDEPALDPAAAAVVRAFFASRVVDVAVGVGASTGAYPIRFDWVVVLDPGSREVVSLVLNCRD